MRKSARAICIGPSGDLHPARVPIPFRHAIYRWRHMDHRFKRMQYISHSILNTSGVQYLGRYLCTYQCRYPLSRVRTKTCDVMLGDSQRARTPRKRLSVANANSSLFPEPLVQPPLRTYENRHLTTRSNVSIPVLTPRLVKPLHH